MFVAIYRFRVRPGLESRYAADWQAATDIAIKEYGSAGSALCQEPDGTFVAIARWRCREDRQRFFNRADADPEARARQAEAIVERFPTLELDVIDDRWTALSPPGS